MDYRLFKGSSKAMQFLVRVDKQSAGGTGFTIGSHGSFKAPSSGAIELRANSTPLPVDVSQLEVLLVVRPQ